MARTGIEKGQVVWAKLGGYPWWPGIVRDRQVDETSDEAQGKDVSSETCRVTVKFIGENTQCVPHSASLHSSKVVDFEDFLLEHSRTKKKHLLRCIEYAKKFANGDLHLTDLTIINERLDRKKRQGTGSGSPESAKKVRKTEGGKRNASESDSGERRKSSAVDCGKKDVVLSIAGECREKRPAAALLTTKQITWNAVHVSVSCPIKCPTSALSTDAKVPDPPSGGKLITPVSLPYLRQGANNQVSLAQSALVSFMNSGIPSAEQITKLLLSLLQVEVPLVGLQRFLRILKHFSTSLSDAHRPLSRLAQKLFFALKQQAVTQTLKGMIKIPERLTPALSTSSSVEVPLETPQPSLDSPPLLKDDGSTCSVDVTTADIKPEDFGESVNFPESEEFVADKEKRKNVCLAVYRILALNRFSVSEARDLALRMEQRLRRKDPTMGDKYSAQYKKMIRDIRALTPEGLKKDN